MQLPVVAATLLLSLSPAHAFSARGGPTTRIRRAAQHQRLSVRPRLSAENLPSDVLLKASIAALDEDAMEEWLMRRGWSSVLLMQPMLLEKIKPSPPRGMMLTFRRKPTDAKGGTDGGLRFALSRDEGILLVTRVSEGQSISKSFSERILVRKLVSELESLPEALGQVTAVVHEEMLGDTEPRLGD